MTETDIKTFIKEYEKATNSHDFEKLKPLIDSKATYWFTDGSFKGHKEIENAIKGTWDKIRNEKYKIQRAQIIFLDNKSSGIKYEFLWEGIVRGKVQKGSGRGTNIITKNQSGKLQVVHEHLSK